MHALFGNICRTLSLGTLVCEPQRLSGGYTHRMFSLTTTQGRYAVKLLNPEIMQRPGVLDNYARAEHFESLLEARGLPILPALTIAGRKLHSVDGQYLYVFDYFDGCVLSDEAITPAHCAAMGDILARIHAAARREDPDAPEAPAPIDWPGLADALLACPDTRSAGEQLHAALPLLQQLTQTAEDAVLRLPRQQALCHNDMDPKNVLWQGDAFRIIDLECLGWADPLQEALDLAVTWAGAALDESKFKAFLRSYRDAGGQPIPDAALYYDSRRSYLDWLAYNARRARFDDGEEARMGKTQIAPTLRKLECDLHNRPVILRWIEEIQ